MHKRREWIITTSIKYETPIYLMKGKFIDGFWKEKVNELEVSKTLWKTL